MTNIICMTNICLTNFWVFCSSLVSPIRFNALFAFPALKTWLFLPRYFPHLSGLWMNPQVFLLLFTGVSVHFSLEYLCHVISSCSKWCTLITSPAGNKSIIFKWLAWVTIWQQQCEFSAAFTFSSVSLSLTPPYHFHSFRYLPLYKLSL